MTARLFQGHALDVLATLPADSVSACITSSPYWGLRAYGSDPQVWDSPEGGCVHEWAAWRRRGTSGGTASVKVHSKGEANFQIVPDREQATCTRCGAWRGELGSEPDPESFIRHLVTILRAVRRVLHPTGACLLNLGDTFYSNPGGQNGGAKNGLDYGAGRPSTKVREANRQVGRQQRTGRGHDYLKPKDLCLIPFRTAEALQRDGWWLRALLPWIKRSCLPESVTDRPTSAVEYWLLLTKRGSSYYWDAEAVRQTVVSTHAPDRVRFAGKGNPPEREFSGGVHRLGYNPSGRSFRASDLWWESLRAILDGGGVVPSEDGEWLGLDLASEPNDSAFCSACERLYDGPTLRLIRTSTDADGQTVRECPGCGRTDAWVAHFAAFPPRLIVPLVRATTSDKGCCAACGAPWRREVKREPLGPPLRTTAGWVPTCRCPAGTPTRLAAVLDPFLGSGTTCMVAERLGRDSIGIELNPAYLALARRRIVDDAPLLTTVETKTTERRSCK